MEQMSFIFQRSDAQELKHIVKESYLEVRHRYPKPVDGESKEEYNLFIRDETLLEIAFRLTDIATRRQRDRINLLYSKDCDDTDLIGSK